MNNFCENLLQLLQAIQNQGHCCGYGMKDKCAIPTKTWLALQGEKNLYRNCSDQGQYCVVSATKDGQILSNCSLQTQWDFPFGGEGQGNDGRCLEKNMKSGDG